AACAACSLLSPCRPQGGQFGGSCAGRCRDSAPGNLRRPSREAFSCRETPSLIFLPSYLFRVILNWEAKRNRNRAFSGPALPLGGISMKILTATLSFLIAAILASGLAPSLPAQKNNAPGVLQPDKGKFDILLDGKSI